MKHMLILGAMMLIAIGMANGQTSRNTNQTEQAEHYTFQLSDKVTREAVTFKNRYGITVSGDLYMPKDRSSGRIAALVISGPFGAVKEQSAGLYANELAARGFAALAFDPSFTGESGGDVRNVGSPEIFTEDFTRPWITSACCLPLIVTESVYLGLRFEWNGAHRRHQRFSDQSCRHGIHVRHVPQHEPRK